MHKVFISYHHENDQWYKDQLVKFGHQNSIFVDKSVDTGDISNELGAQSIREKIRDEYLQDSTVTIVLVGAETNRRKHVDWEIYSSMYDGPFNKKSGVLVINLPETKSQLVTAPHGNEEKRLYPDITSWTSINTWAEYERLYPYMPDRIIDNLLKPEAKISIVPWGRIKNAPKRLEFLVDVAFRDRVNCEYDLRRPMRDRNS